VDGDTSTNDTLVVLANGAAGNACVSRKGKDFDAFAGALGAVCLDLAKMLARDGEGATRLVEIEVRRAPDEVTAKRIAATIATSPLVKTAVFGNDANWGRILAAAGRAGVPFKPERVAISIGGLLVARDGMAVKFSEARAKKILQKKEVPIVLDLGSGTKSAKYYTCDFSFDYVKINASYRS
jgi:glutamate N-acetyltransferase/amino-acid N-acetyltransferase